MSKETRQKKNGFITEVEVKFPEIREILKKLYSSAYESGRTEMEGDGYDHSTAYEEIEQKLQQFADTIIKEERNRTLEIIEEWKDKGFEINTLIERIKIMKIEDVINNQK